MREDAEQTMYSWLCLAKRWRIFGWFLYGIRLAYRKTAQDAGFSFGTRVMQRAFGVYMVLVTKSMIVNGYPRLRRKSVRSKGIGATYSEEELKVDLACIRFGKCISR